VPVPVDDRSGATYTLRMSILIYLLVLNVGVVLGMILSSMVRGFDRQHDDLPELPQPEHR
jgi:hypothetical protein